MIRVLHILSSLSGGGVGKCLLNYYNNINRDEIVFDFIVCGDSIGILEETIKKMGSKIYHVTPKKKSYIKNLLQTKKILKTENYDIVHCHQDYHGVEAIYLAKKAKVKRIISHCHISDAPETRLEKIRRLLSTRMVEKHATDFFACSSDAAKWMFGNKNTYIMKNAIDVDEFNYDDEKRKEVRKKMNLENKFVIGNVGRFVYQKNHDFLIDIFNEICKIDENAVLLLAGDGALEKDIIEKVKTKNLAKKVIFLGVRNDICDLMQAMDVFVFPTRYEGLGIVIVEAQTSGLKCVISDCIPQEAVFGEMVKQISLSETAEVWAKKICSIKDYHRKNNIKLAEYNGYSIKKQAKELEKKYFDILGGNK